MNAEPTNAEPTLRIGTPIGIEVHCKYSKMVGTGELKAHPDNPNQHPPEQLRLFAKILQHQGWRRAIVVSNLSGFIVAGHGALEAARLLKCETVPVDYQDFRSKADEMAHLLADNELAQLAERHKGSEEKNQAAAALGRLGAGVPKNYTPAERARRRAHMERLNAARRLAAKLKAKT